MPDEPLFDPALEPVTFTRVVPPYGWLSNMSPYPVTHAGVEWRTAEHLFQAMRFYDPRAGRFPDPAVPEEIRTYKSPMAAKMAAARHADKMVVVPASPDDVILMALVLAAKVEQHTVLLAGLLATASSTGSMASMVAPAVTISRLPRRLFFFSERRASTNATMSVGSAMRPLPESPLASSPSAGSTIRTPRLRRIRRFSCVAECANMSRSIAGATATGQRAER